MQGSKVAVLGGGNGGFAAAADLTLRGFDVTLYNRSAETIAAIGTTGGIRYQGVLGEGFCPIAVTTDMQRAVEQAALVEVCAPAPAHAGYAEAMAPHLPPGVPIVLNPGGMLGSLFFARTLRAAGYVGPVRIGETATLTYICRKSDADRINITASLKQVGFAALPGTNTADLAASLEGTNLDLAPRPHILAAGLDNVNLILHPPGMILAAAWIEHSGGRFAYYYDAATPAVAQVMAGLDSERLAIGTAFRVQADSLPSLFAAIGSTTQAAAASGSYLRALRDSTPNRHIQAPDRLNHRYLSDDVPYGLVPLEDLAKRAGVSTPIMSSLITLAGTVNQTDYRASGRRLERLGWGELQADAILRHLIEGE